MINKLPAVAIILSVLAFILAVASLFMVHSPNVRVFWGAMIDASLWGVPLLAAAVGALSLTVLRKPG